MINLIKQINRDKEIIEMRDFVYKNTGEMLKLLFWEGETIEEYKEKLRKRVKEIKDTKNYN